MAKKKPTVTPRKPVPVPEASARALEDRWAQRDALPAGASLPPTKKPTSSPRTAPPAEPSSGRSVTRKRGAWSKAEPYVRRDGTATRSTTVYLATDLADRLRRFAFDAERRQSEIIAEALALHLDRLEALADGDGKP